MPPTVTQLTARSQSLLVALLLAMATMAVSPLVEDVALRWPLRFGDPAWRYDTLVLFLSNGPQLVILFSVIAILGTLTGYRVAVRATAIAFGVLVLAHLVLVPLMVLDFIQVKRLVSQSRAASFKMLALKTGGFAIVVALYAAWCGLRAWQSSEDETAGQRRQKGQGLVVGQAGERSTPR